MTRRLAVGDAAGQGDSCVAHEYAPRVEHVPDDEGDEVPAAVDLTLLLLHGRQGRGRRTRVRVAERQVRVQGNRESATATATATAVEVTDDGTDVRREARRHTKSRHKQTRRRKKVHTHTHARCSDAQRVQPCLRHAAARLRRQLGTRSELRRSSGGGRSRGRRRRRPRSGPRKPGVQRACLCVRLDHRPQCARA